MKRRKATSTVSGEHGAIGVLVRLASGAAGPVALRCTCWFGFLGLPFYDTVEDGSLYLGLQILATPRRRRLGCGFRNVMLVGLSRVLCGVVCVCVPSFGVGTYRLTNHNNPARERPASAHAALAAFARLVAGGCTTATHGLNKKQKRGRRAAAAGGVSGRGGAACLVVLFCKPAAIWAAAAAAAAISNRAC